MKCHAKGRFCWSKLAELIGPALLHKLKLNTTVYPTRCIGQEVISMLVVLVDVF